MLKTAARVLAVLAFAMTVWSLNVAWGDDPALRGGPPKQWERHVVGAALLGAVAAVLIFVGSRSRAHVAVRAAACAAAFGPVVIAFVLRSDASSQGLPQLVAGPGWTWLTIGGGLAVLAAAMTLAIRRTPERKPARGR